MRLALIKPYRVVLVRFSSDILMYPSCRVHCFWRLVFACFVGWTQSCSALVEDELDVEELVVALWRNKLGVKVRERYIGLTLTLLAVLFNAKERYRAVLVVGALFFLFFFFVVYGEACWSSCLIVPLLLGNAVVYINKVMRLAMVPQTDKRTRDYYFLLQ